MVNKIEERKRTRGRILDNKALLPSPLAMSFVDVCDRWAHKTTIRERRQKEKAALPVRRVHLVNYCFNPTIQTLSKCF
jgi:hypothetical protein